MAKLPKSLIKKYGISKKAWRIFKSRSKKTRTTRRKTKPKRRRTYLVRRKRRRGKRSMTIPLAPIAGLLGSPAIGAMINGVMTGNIDAVSYEAGRFVGIDAGKFNAGLLLTNITPLIVGLLVHKFVGGPPLNLNRTLAAANVPFLRI